MLWILILIVAIAIYFFFSQGVANYSNVKKYGPPSHFLINVVSNLDGIFFDKRILTNNEVILRIKYLDSETATELIVAFLYLKNIIQVTFWHYPAIGSKIVKVIKCPYNPKEVNSQVIKTISLLIKKESNSQFNDTFDSIKSQFNKTNKNSMF